MLEDIYWKYREGKRTEAFNDQLGNSLSESVTVSCCENTAFGKHVDDGWKEQPPGILLVAIVEDTVFQPVFLVFIKSGDVTFHLLQLVGRRPNFEGEECEHSREECERDAC